MKKSMMIVVATMLSTPAMAWGFGPLTAGQLTVGQTGEGDAYIQNTGDPITITDAIGNRGNCSVYLHPFTAQRLGFGDHIEVVFSGREYSGSHCDLIELRLVTSAGTFTFNW